CVLDRQRRRLLGRLRRCRSRSRYVREGFSRRRARALARPIHRLVAFFSRLRQGSARLGATQSLPPLVPAQAGTQSPPFAACDPGSPLSRGRTEMAEARASPAATVPPSASPRRCPETPWWPARRRRRAGDP